MDNSLFPLHHTAAMPLASTPARLPANRGIHWFVEAWRAVQQKPLLWLSAALVLVAAQSAVLALWAAKLAAGTNQDFLSGFAVAMSAITLTPIVLLCSLPLPVAAFSGAARRQFLPYFQSAHPMRRLLHALGFSALLAALLIAASAATLLLWYSIIAALQPHMHYVSLEIVSAACACLLAVCVFWLALLILLAQVLAACGTPFFSALTRAASAALQPACVVHATALATGTAAAFAALMEFDSLAPHTWLLTLVCSYAFALDALITPWLMARDMFRIGAE